MNCTDKITIKIVYFLLTLQFFVIILSKLIYYFEYAFFIAFFYPIKPLNYLFFIIYKYFNFGCSPFLILSLTSYTSIMKIGKTL